MFFIPWKWPSSSPPSPRAVSFPFLRVFCLSNSSQCPGRLLFVASFLTLLSVHTETWRAQVCGEGWGSQEQLQVPGIGKCQLCKQRRMFKACGLGELEWRTGSSAPKKVRMAKSWAGAQRWDGRRALDDFPLEVLLGALLLHHLLWLLLFWRYPKVT